MRLKGVVLSAMVLALALAIITGCGRPQSGGSGGRETKGQMIQIKGSDTMVNLGQAWAEAYMKNDSGANIAVTGGGSGVGITAMIEGTTDIAQASRAMKDKEKNLAIERGVNPVEHIVATDALSVIVHPSNPVDKLTIDQLSDIYTGRITNWKQVGGVDHEITALSRDKSSGSHVFFLEHVVRRGSENGPEEFAPSTLMLPSSTEISNQVANNKYAIGYVGLGYVDPKIHKAVSVAQTDTGPYVAPSVETAVNQTYPVARPLYWYTNGEPEGNVKSFLDFVMSKEGQEIVDETGFAPAKA